MLGPTNRKRNTRRTKRAQLPVAGWREYVGFPELGIDQLKAKIDTGARSSALHAWNITPIEVDGAQWVAFEVHPLQRNNKVTVHCRAPLTAKRRVTSSSGHSEHRYVIETALRIGDRVYPVELSLTNRDAMGFRLLLGRTAIRGRFLVDAGRSYLVGNSQ